MKSLLGMAQSDDPEAAAAATKALGSLIVRNRVLQESLHDAEGVPLLTKLLDSSTAGATFAAGKHSMCLCATKRCLPKYLFQMPEICAFQAGTVHDIWTVLQNAPLATCQQCSLQNTTVLGVLHVCCAMTALCCI